MGRHLAYRLLSAIPVLIVVSLVSFLIIFLALAAWVAYQVFIVAPQHGLKQLENKSESSSLPDPPSDVLNQLVSQGGVPPCWELSQQGATRCS